MRGETGQIDKSGADRSAEARGHGLVYLSCPRGEAAPSPFWSGGVWLVQIPPDRGKKWQRISDPARESGRTPQGGNKQALATMRPRRKLVPPHWHARKAGPDWFRSGGSKAGVRRARGHGPTGAGFALNWNSDPLNFRAANEANIQNQTGCRTCIGLASNSFRLNVDECAEDLSAEISPRLKCWR